VGVKNRKREEEFKTLGIEILEGERGR